MRCAVCEGEAVMRWFFRLLAVGVGGGVAYPQQKNQDHEIRWTIYRAKESVYVFAERRMHSPIDALEKVNPDMLRIMTENPLYVEKLIKMGAPAFVTRSVIHANVVIVDERYVIFDGFSSADRKIIEDRHLARKYLQEWKLLQKTAKRIKSD
jgi:hypothetical protein